MLASLGTGGYVVHTLANAIPKNGIAAYLKIGKAFSYWCYTTLSANVLGTGEFRCRYAPSLVTERSAGLIAGRIWWIRRETKGTFGSTSDAVSHIVTLIVESAFVYSAVLTAEIVCIALE